MGVVVILSYMELKVNVGHMCPLREDKWRLQQHL